MGEEESLEMQRKGHTWAGQRDPTLWDGGVRAQLFHDRAHGRSPSHHPNGDSSPSVDLPGPGPWVFQFHSPAMCKYGGFWVCLEAINLSYIVVVLMTGYIVLVESLIESSHHYASGCTVLINCGWQSGLFTKQRMLSPVTGRILQQTFRILSDSIVWDHDTATPMQLTDSFWSNGLVLLEKMKGAGLESETGVDHGEETLRRQKRTCVMGHLNDALFHGI